MVPTTPKGLTSQISLMLMALSIRWRVSALLLMMLAICRLAMLNDLEGELSVMELSRHSAETEAKGVYL